MTTLRTRADPRRPHVVARPRWRQTEPMIGPSKNGMFKMTTIRSPLIRKALAIAVMATAVPAAAQQSDLVGVVADGRPWSLTQSDGRAGKVTLFADGRGTIRLGDSTISPTWRKAESCASNLSSSRRSFVQPSAATVPRSSARMAAPSVSVSRDHRVPCAMLSE
jgi:hypothetical protein